MFGDRFSNNINCSVIPRLAQYLYAKNIENILVGGILGEGSQLTLCERKVLYKAWVDVAKPLNITVITEVAGMSSREVFELVKYCVQIGVDVLIALPPLIYIPESPQELVTALLLLYDLSPGLPWLYYDIPSLTGVKLDMVEFYKLATAQIPNFIGIVCDLQTAVQVDSRIKLKRGQRLLVRDSNNIKDAFDLGFSSITASASIYPDHVRKINNPTDKRAAAEAQAYLNKINSPVLTQHGKPNTYTFTKALAEHLVSESHGVIPTVIIRPSIVTPAKDEPLPGWVENWYGATGLLTAFAKGFCRVLYTTDDHITDLIPVDYVSNLTLIAAARTTEPSEVAVYNSCSASTNHITTSNFINKYIQAGIKDGFNSLPCPQLLIFTKRYWLVQFITFLMYCVAYILDFFSSLLCIKTRYLKHLSQTVMIRTNLDYFTSHSMLFKSKKSHALYETLSPSDASLFPCLARDIDWKQYIPIYFQGVKKYLIEKKRM